MAWDTSPEGTRRRSSRQPFALASALGWLGLVLMQGAGHGQLHEHGSAASMSRSGGGMEHDHLSAAVPMQDHHHTAWSFALMYLLMVLAMMAPMAVAQVRHVRDQSLTRCRNRATAQFLSGYAVVAVAFGVAFRAAWSVFGDGPVVVGTLVTLLVVWQLTPFKQTCLNGHALMPSLRAFSPGAGRDASRFGFKSGVWAFGGCWAFMVVPMYLGGWQLLATVIASAWIWAELFDYPAPARWGWHVPRRGFRIGAALAVVSPRRWWRILGLGSRPAAAAP